jgi:hypothetical protein
MSKVKYDARLDGTRESHVDALLDKTVIEYKARVSSLRGLNAAYMKLAKLLAEKEDLSAILLLDQPKVSKKTLANEWDNLDRLFRSEIASRLRSVVFTDGEPKDFFGKLSPEEREALSGIQQKLSRESKRNRRTPDASNEVLRVLLVHWFRRSGSLQINHLGALCGFSYPTIASALEKLKDSLVRHSDRSVELDVFPKNAWFKLVAANDEIRVPRAYRARKPKSVNELLGRLMEKSTKDIALGGVLGARHYLPGIDLVGAHRLDVTVDNWNATKIDRLVKRLDPGLKPVELKETPQLVVHSLYRREPLFEKGERFPIADEVECLLDLHEARLEQQALELLEHFKRNTRKSSQTV